MYAARFAGKSIYRQAVWRQLCGFFNKWIPRDAAILDLGCGYGEFLNAVECRRKYGIDFNPDALKFACPDATVFLQDSSIEWGVPAGSIDVIFTSNFFEHLPSKQALELTLVQAFRALRCGGRLIAMGPNIRFVPGQYWDYFDHHLPLTDRSLIEVLEKCGFQIDFGRGRFLPYTMSGQRDYPIWMLRVYLALPIAWRVFGKQFLVVASKPQS